MPSAHDWHVEPPSTADTWPGGHAVQFAAPPARCANPRGQAAHADARVALANFPGTHSVHAPLFTAVHVPAEHAVHAVDDAPAANPAGHSLHSEACAAGCAKVPSPHGSHAPRLAVARWPSVHAAHAVADGPDAWPTGHSQQLFVPSR